MEGEWVLGLVGRKALHAEESRSACALTEVSGFMPLTELASPIVRSSLESLVSHAYYYIPTIKPQISPKRPSYEPRYFLSILRIRRIIWTLLASVLPWPRGHFSILQISQTI